MLESASRPPQRARMERDLSLNQAAHDLVVENPVNGTFPYTKVRYIKARAAVREVRAALGGDDLRPPDATELATSLSFLERMGDSPVLVVTQNLVDSRHPDKGRLLANAGYWDPRLGVLVGKSLPRAPGLSTPFHWNVALDASDKCSYVTNKLAGKRPERYFVDAVVSGLGKRLDVLRVVPLQCSTFWNYDLHFNPDMLGELGYPPLVILEKKMYTADETIVIPEFQMIPQCSLSNGDPPVHWISLVVASDGSNVYAVFLDATYAQFNPQGVIAGAQLMKRLIPGYRAVHAGAPKGFLVGEHAAETSPYDQVIGWFEESSGESLSGASIGKLGDYHVVYA